MVLLLAALLVAVDQLSKAWIVRTLPVGGQEIPLALGFRLVHTRNDGAAFGMFRNVDLHIGPLQFGGALLLGLLSLAVSVALLVYLIRRGRSIRTLTRIALTVVMAGAIGNMIDRLRLGYVVDFVHFKVGSFDFPIFNIADASVVTGAGLLLIAGLLGNESQEPPPMATPRREAGPELPPLPPLREGRDEATTQQAPEGR